MSLNNLIGYSFRNPTLRKIHELYSDYEKEAEIVKKSWNNKIRDYLRDKMGVKLIDERGEAIPVPVRIKTSYDNHLSTSLKHDISILTLICILLFFNSGMLLMKSSHILNILLQQTPLIIQLITLKN